jgi:thiol:disulfide interchange protein
MFRKRSHLSGFVVLLLLLILAHGSCTRETAEIGGGLEWLTSFDSALQTAQQKKKPVMIDFYADWCGWCKRLDTDTYAHADVVSKAGDFIALKIDADVRRDISSRYRIAGLPTILFIDQNGSEIHRVVGYRRPNQFVQEMEAALKVFKGKTGK